MSSFPCPPHPNHRHLTIYGNWSAYDELSDGVPLTEEMAMTQLDHVQRLRGCGVTIDAYLMDAFWFDPDGAYRTWRTPHWPNGPDEWLRRCENHGLIPGLWFTANTLCHLNLPSAWAESADPSGWGVCMFHGPFLQDYLEILGLWYRRGIRIFKLDFADFSAAPETLKLELLPEEIRGRNIQAFREALREFRISHPEAILMGFNGFESREYMDRTDRPAEGFSEPIIDLEWFEVFDSIYSGDPRPADVPAAPFWRSVDIYADHTTRLVHASGIPLSRIDNCGFMAGPTGTCYWRGKSGWRAMLALTYARGGDLTVLYGDLGAFDDTDARWIAEIQRLFDGARLTGPAAAIGGVPGLGETYGWAWENRALVACNPSPYRSTLEIPFSVERWPTILSDEGPAPVARGYALDLAPFQVAVLSSPKFGSVSERYDDPSDLQVSDLESISLTESRFSSRETRFETFLESEGQHVMFVKQLDLDGALVRTFPTQEIARSLRILVSQGGLEVPAELFHDRIVWSGMSWGGAAFNATAGAITIQVSWDDPRIDRIVGELWRRIPAQ